MEAVSSIEQSHKYVTFRVNKELFGVHIETVQQIISPDKITPVPKTPQYFMGLLNLRGETISTIDLRVLFNLPKIKPHFDQRIAIVDYKRSRLGVLVDHMEGVINVPLGQVRPPPPLLDPKMMEYLIGSYQIDENNTLLLLDQELLIDPRQFKHEELDIRQEHKGIDAGDLMTTEPERILLGFELGHGLYLLNVDDVEELIQKPIITQIPRASHIIEGVFHLRQEVIPLIRLTNRLGLPDEEYQEDTTILVVNVAGVKLGIIVGKIREVLRLKESKIEPLPKNITGKRAAHLGGIVQSHVNGAHTIQSLLLLEKLFTEPELRRLADFQEKEMQSEVFEEDDEEILLLLKFKIAGEPYALRVYQVHQIINLLPLLKIPKAPPHVMGIMNVRGEIITVLDIPRLLDSQFPLDREKAKIIIVEIKSGKIGFLVDEVTGITHLSNSIFDIPDDWGENEEHRLVEAIGREENGQVTVLLNIHSAFHHAIQYVTQSLDFEVSQFG